MLFGLTSRTFTTFLNYFGSSKVQSSPNNTRPPQHLQALFATRAYRDLDRQDSTQLRAQQDFTASGPPPMLPPTKQISTRQLVLAPRTE